MKTETTDWQNRLYFGDNLPILREHVADESVDLIYLDPPFNSQATYNVLFGEKNGTQSQAQITAFEDTWHWGEESERAYREVVRGGPKKLSDLIQALRGFLGQNDMMAYLTMMSIRLVELRRVLKLTGSIYLHCDPTASHYLKLVLDAVFDPSCFRNDVTWRRHNARSTSGRWPRVHDVLLYYTRSPSYTFHAMRVTGDIRKTPHTLITGPDGLKYQTYELTAPGITKEGVSGKPWRGYNPSSMGRHWANRHEIMDRWDENGLIHWPRNGGFPRRRAAQPFILEERKIMVGDVWSDIHRINQSAAERLGYPTQKPEALLERIIKSSSNEGDIVLDPFCGCGTTINVAERLHRRWIGIDITHLAIALIKNRLHDTFATELSPYEVLGAPKDLASARALAQQDRYQFEWWALSLIDARPAQDKKKGADSGVDGYINFFDDGSGKAKKIVVQVKSGHVAASQIRDLKAVVEREKAVIGVFITLEPATKPMSQEAVSAGYYAPEHLAKEHTVPKIQIVTIAELLEGAQILYPRLLVTTFKQAQRKYKETGPKQEELL